MSIVVLIIAVITPSFLPVPPVWADSSFKFSFMCVSDTHMPNYNTNLINALQDATQNSCSAICFVGDITEDGKDASYDALNSTLNSNPHPPAYFVVGNHDVRWLSGYAEGRDRFLAKTGMPGMYYDVWIYGYHFIFLATEQDLKDQAYLSSTQLSWLQTKLADQATSNKPVFVFIHQALANTVVGTTLAEGYGASYPDGVVQDQELKNILGQFPQTIFFTGHTHAAVTSTNNLYNAQYCTMINDGCVKNNQGLLVNVYGDRVEVLGRNLSTKTTISNATVSYNPQPSIAQGKTASADSSQSANPSANGNDGSTLNTRWCANDGSTGHWWKVDLGTISNLTGTQIKWEASAVYQYKIDLSNDNSAWTTVVNKTGNTTAAQIMADNFSASGRYVRITVTGLPSGRWASFYDFSVFGGVGPTPTPTPSSTPTPTPTPSATPTPTPTGGIVSGATYKIISKSSAKLIEVTGGSTLDGALIEQWSDNGGNHQKWRVDDMGSGWYKLTNINSGKVLDVPGSSTATSVQLKQWTDHGGTNQRFKIEDMGSGYYRITAQCSNLVLDVQGNSTTNGAAIIQYTNTGGNNQQWQFVRQ